MTSESNPIVVAATLPVLPRSEERRDADAAPSSTPSDTASAESISDKHLSDASERNSIAEQRLKPSGEGLAEFAPAPARLADVFLPKSRRANPDLDACATQRSVFDDPIQAPHHLPPPEYENFKNFDVNLRWTWREEKAVVRIIDFRVLLVACIAFASLNLDRNNLSAANSAGILPDLGLTTNDFNLATTLFRISFLCAELPGQVLSKAIGPDRFIPLQMGAWAIITLFQFFLTGRTSFLICRCLLGLAQGSFIPDLLLYLSYYYKSNELYLRLGLFWCTMNLTSFVSSFFAYGLIAMGGVGGKEGWRWLFFWEGVLTLLIAIGVAFAMPPSPSQTQRKWDKKGFFDDRQAAIAVTRVLRDDPGKSTMHNREALGWQNFKTSLLDYHMYPIWVHGLLFGIPSSPVQQYLTLSLRRLGFSTLLTQVLNSVQYLGAMVTGIGIVVLSELLDSRALVSAAEDLWILPFLVAIFKLPKNPKPWTYFGLATVLLSNPYVHPIQAAWISANAGDVGNRSLHASYYNMMVQAGSTIAANVYRQDDAPEYKRGNTALIVIACTNIALYVGSRFFYKTVNARRQRRWDAMSEEEQKHYLATTSDKGNKLLTFRFAY